MSKVTVIIATHNRPNLLTAAIESARHSGSDVEIIVVDDASTDNTPDVCGALQGIRYIRLPENRGLAVARNVGIHASETDLVAFLDDDDLRLPNSLDLQLRELEASPGAVLCYGRLLAADAIHRRPTGEVIPRLCPSGDIFWDLLEQNFVSPVAVLAYKRALVECGLFRSGLGGVEDWDLWLRVAERYSVAAVTEPVAIYRKANTMSGQMCSDSVSMYRQMFRVQQSALQLPRAAAAPLRRVRRARSKLLSLVYDGLVYEARMAIVDGDYRTAGAKVREAFRLRPLYARTDIKLLGLRARLGKSERNADPMNNKTSDTIEQLASGQIQSSQL